MKVTTKQIREASRCLKYHSLSLTEDLVQTRTIELSTVDDVFRKSYAQALETGFRPDWRAIIGWVDKSVFRDIDIQNEEAFENGKSIAERILIFLSRWYNEIFLEEQLYGYPLVNVSKQVGNVLVESELPIVKLAEVPTILTVDSIVCHDSQLYNNIEIRTQMWLVANALQNQDVGYQRLTMGTQGGFTNTTIMVDKQGQQRTEKMLSQLTRLMYQRVDYPSVSEQCIQCPFRRRCRI